MVINAFSFLIFLLEKPLMSMKQPFAKCVTLEVWGHLSKDQNTDAGTRPDGSNWAGLRLANLSLRGIKKKQTSIVPGAKEKGSGVRNCDWSSLS